MKNLLLLSLLVSNCVAMEHPKEHKHHTITIHIDEKDEPAELEQKTPTKKSIKQKIMSHCQNESTKVKIALITAATTIIIALIVNLTKCPTTN